MSDQTAVLEQPTADTLRAEMTRLQDEYDAYRDQLHALHAQRYAGTLDRAGYVEYLYTEDQLKVLFRRIEHLKPRVRYQEMLEAVTAGTQHYDSYCPLVAELGRTICQQFADFIATCGQFRDLVDEQARLVAGLPAANGQPAFELLGGAEALTRLLLGMRQGGSLYDTVWQFVRQPLTTGEATAAVEGLPQVQRFAPLLITRFLAGYAPPEEEAA